MYSVINNQIYKVLRKLIRVSLTLVFKMQWLELQTWIINCAYCLNKSKKFWKKFKT